MAGSDAAGVEASRVEAGRLEVGRLEVGRFDEPPDLRALALLVRDCSVSGVSRRVLLLRTDLLPRHLSRPHHQRLAQEAMEPLGLAERACRYALAHGRLAVSWRGAGTARLDEAMGLLSHLLQDSPLASSTELVRVFDLPVDGAALLALATSPTRAEQRVLDAVPPVVAAPLPPLDEAMLDGIELKLSRGNVARFARRRQVCRVGPQGVSPAWEGRFLCLRELMAALAPGHDAFADPWLLRRLSGMADRRLMALLSCGPELQAAGPFSLGLDVASVLSAEFLRFDAGLPPGLRGQALLDLRPGDVMADLPAYRFARAFARVRGYRVVLRDVTPALLALLDLVALDLDFVELAWTPGLLGVEAGLLRAGAARWVLGGVDDAVGMHWGRAMGVGFFEGSAVAGECPA